MAAFSALTHHRDKAQRDPVLKGINQNSADLFNGDLDEHDCDLEYEPIFLQVCCWQSS